MQNLINKKQVAEILGVSVKTVDLWISQGKAPKHLRVGRLVKFIPSDVEEFIQKLSEGI
jgi:excisionase family DNA binding protein